MNEFDKKCWDFVHNSYISYDKLHIGSRVYPIKGWHAKTCIKSINKARTIAATRKYPESDYSIVQLNEKYQIIKLVPLKYAMRAMKLSQI
jgi:hypothetical protein